MAAQPQVDRYANLRNAFDDLNVHLSSSYNCTHLPLLRDLVIEYIFFERPDISMLPWGETPTIRHSLAENLSTKFMRTCAYTMWAYPDPIRDIEEHKRLSLEGFMMAVLDLEAYKWQARDSMQVLIWRLTVD